MRWTKKSYFLKSDLWDEKLVIECACATKIHRNYDQYWFGQKKRKRKRKKIEEELKKRRRRRTNNAIKGKILLINPSSSKIFQIFFSKRSFYFAMAEKSPQGHYLVQGRKNGREMPYFFNTTLVEIYLSAWLCIYKDEFLQSLCGKLGVSY